LAGDPKADDAALLRTLVEALEAETGEAFFRSLVERLARALGVAYAFVSELTRGGSHFRTLALWARGAIAPDFEVPLDGTPCEAVLRGTIAHHPAGLQRRFPRDTALADWRAESYAGVPLLDRSGTPLGHFAIVDDRPMPDAARALDVMRIFAARTAAELERRRAEQRVLARERMLSRIIASASDGIVSYEEDGTLLVFNPAAERILRCPAEQALGTPVWRFATEEGAAIVGRAFERLRADPNLLIFAGEADGVRALRADGTTFVQEASLSRAEIDGRPVYTVIFRDVEERRSSGLALDALRLQNAYLREELERIYPFEEIVGRSPTLGRVLEDVARVAGTDASVLIRGETGTGKELVARAIHAQSRRRDRALVKVNCTALPPGLVESELFGHEKGAFTGASERRVGRFELASGGTIFLDEVGEIPLEVQAKLLRVLQERELERVGGEETIRVDVRVIAATNRDLEKGVAEGTFREDLFYRLNVFPIAVPSLRERADDIPLLAQYFTTRAAAKLGKRITGIAPETLARMAAYPWPGNVRELENVIERAAILAPGPVLEIAPETLGGAAPRSARAEPREAPPDASLAEVERAHIAAVLRSTGGKVDGPDGAARLLGLRPSTLRSRLKKLGIAR
jgi:PAS domain S-box-containing protein